MKKGWKWGGLVAIALLLLFVLFAYINSTKNSGNPSCTDNSCSVSGIANPASVYCVAHNGTSKIITASDGSQSGLCRFADGTECDEWKFFRGEC